MVAQESVKRGDTRLVLAQSDECAVTPEPVGMQRSNWHAGFSRITKDEFTRFDGAPLSGQWIDAAALDERLTNTVPEAERIEVARLRAKVLCVQNANAGKSVI